MKQIKEELQAKLVQTLRDCEWSEERISEILAKKNLEEGYEIDSEKLKLDDNILNIVEYIKVDVDGKVKERE